jgi:excisionase family DNA binding protein
MSKGRPSETAAGTVDAKHADGVNVTVTLTNEQVERLAAAVAALLAERQPAQNGTASPWLSTSDAATYLRCSPDRIHDLVARRALTPRRDGRRLLFRRADLDGYLEADA